MEREPCKDVAEAIIEAAKLVKAGNYQEVLYYCDEALRLNPELAKVWVNKGAILSRMAHPSEAIECFRRALTIDPRCADDVTTAALPHQSQHFD